MNKISVVMPSYNSAKFISESIKSVINQKYSNWELLINDNLSTDGTADIIRMFLADPRIKLTSRKDSGQSNAINYGFSQSNGDILCWLNSNDLFLQDTLEKVNEIFENNKTVNILTGLCKIVDENNTYLYDYKTGNPTFSYLTTKKTGSIAQPSTFWRRKVYIEIGGLREDLHYCMDYEYWLRMLSRYEILFIPEVLSNFRHHENMKSGNPVKLYLEVLRVMQEYNAPKFTKLRLNLYKQVVRNYFR